MAAASPGAVDTAPRGRRATDTGPPDPTFEATEMRDFSRTVAEIEWLLVILVLLFHVFQDAPRENTFAVYAGVAAYCTVILGFHCFNFVRRPGRWSLALETWIMIVFITWVLINTGRLDSPLVNAYLLPIVTSALTLGRLVALLQVGLIAACYVSLGASTSTSFLASAGGFAADLAPMLLVAYITTMLSQDIANAMARIRLISETDELTRAYNMRAFQAIARRECELARRYNRVLSLLMVDSDHLKEVNDTHGHEAGDRLIRLVVSRIRECVRSTDIVARYGGDEFICLLPDTPSEGARKVAERIRSRIEASPLESGTEQLSTSVSIGIATFGLHGDTYEALAKHADSALYRSKSAGRNRVTVYSSSQPGLQPSA